MIKKLLVVMAASAVVAFVCITVLGMIGGFQALNNGPWNFGPWGDWRDGRGPDSGPETTRDLAYSGSSRLNIYYPAEIIYTQGDQPKFTVTGPQFLLDQLRLDDGELTVGGPRFRGRPRFRWNGRNNGRLRIEITAPSLHEFYLAGAQQLRLRNFDQDTLVLQASGAADVEGQGRAHRLEAHITGAGDLKLEDLPVDDAEVMISGAGDARLDARNSARVQISGAGDVNFRCRPAMEPEVHKSGFGDVHFGPDCSTLPAPSAPSSEPAAPAAPSEPAKPAPPAKSKV